MDPDLQAEYAREDPNGLSRLSAEEQMWLGLVATLEYNGETIVKTTPCNGLRKFFFDEDWNFCLLPNIDFYKGGGAKDLIKLKKTRVQLELSNGSPLQDQFDKNNPGIIQIAEGETVKVKCFAVRGEKGYPATLTLKCMRWGKAKNYLIQP